MQVMKMQSFLGMENWFCSPLSGLVLMITTVANSRMKLQLPNKNWSEFAHSNQLWRFYCQALQMQIVSAETQVERPDTI